jgi:hypothetical protein
VRPINETGVPASVITQELAPGRGHRDFATVNLPGRAAIFSYEGEYHFQDGPRASRTLKGGWEQL